MSYTSHASYTSYRQMAKREAHTITKTKKGNETMKLNIDWAGMLKAAVKAIWPFIAGAVGGLFTGCTIGGIGPNFL